MQCEDLLRLLQLACLAAEANYLLFDAAQLFFFQTCPKLQPVQISSFLAHLVSRAESVQSKQFSVFSEHSKLREVARETGVQSIKVNLASPPLSFRLLFPQEVVPSKFVSP